MTFECFIREEEFVETIIKPRDSLDVIWTRDHLERIEFQGQLYKWCIYSYHWVPESNFYNNTSRKDGKHKYCKPCLTDYNQSHKFSPEQKQELLEEQDYICMICSHDLRHLPSRLTPIDVNRETGWVRGVLCKECNTMLGQVQEKVEILKRAVVYLETDGIMSH